MTFATPRSYTSRMGRRYPNAGKKSYYDKLQPKYKKKIDRTITTGQRKLVGESAIGGAVGSGGLTAVSALMGGVHPKHALPAAAGAAMAGAIGFGGAEYVHQKSVKRQLVKSIHQPNSRAAKKGYQVRDYIALTQNQNIRDKSLYYYRKQNGKSIRVRKGRRK